MDIYFKKTRRPRDITCSPLKKPLLKQPTTKSSNLARKSCKKVLFPKLKEVSSSPKKQATILTPTITTKTITPIAKPISTTTVVTKPQTPIKVIENGPLKGISTSLLEFVRAKEAAAKEVTPQQERERELLGIAPDIARIVPTIFTASKREIISFDNIINHCCKSLKMNYTSVTIEECLNLMDKIVPEWTSTVTISRGKFMRFNKDKYTIPQLLEAIKRFKKNS